MPEHPPLIKELCALPVYLGYRVPFEPEPAYWETAYQSEIGPRFLYDGPVPGDRLLAVARLPNLFLGTCLVALIGWWPYRLWGGRAGLVGLALAAVDPNLVAHSALVTTDLGITLFAFLTVYLLWESVERRCLWLVPAVGLAAGLALVSKFTGVLLAGILAVIIAGHVLGGGSLPPAEVWEKKGWRGFLLRSAGAGVVFLLIVGLALLVIPPVYFFQGFGTWRRGFEIQWAHRTAGHNAFFLGQYSQDGWWDYFPVAFVLKTPLGSLLLMAAGLLFFRAGKPLARREALFLLVPPLLFGAALSLAHVNIGLRYALPAFPFLFVLAARLGSLEFRRRWLAPLLVGVPVVLAAASALRIAPHQLAYFNELTGGPGEGYHYLSDSNLDWGQDLKGLRAYMERENVPMVYLSYFGSAPPAGYGIRYQYTPRNHLNPPHPRELLPPGTEREVLAISVTNLQGVYPMDGGPYSEDKDLFRWLREGRVPVAKIGYSIYVYDLTGDADAHLRLAKIYLQDDRKDAAEAELRRVRARDPANAEALRLLREHFGGS